MRRELILSVGLFMIMVQQINCNLPRYYVAELAPDQTIMLDTTQEYMLVNGQRQWVDDGMRTVCDWQPFHKVLNIVYIWG
jgi:hypothetical protein